MSFKCSVLGHSFGEPEAEREREEDGSEVVITITETETCTRCGETRVVSENKEVTTLETPSDIVDDSESGSAAESDDVGTGTDETGAPPSDRPGADRSPAESTATPAPDDGLTDSATGPTDPASDDADDAVILDEGDGEADDGDDERAPGEWPEEDEPTDDWRPETSTDLDPIEDEQPDVEATSGAITVPEGEFVCSECGFTTDVESSSLREGDFCPECHRGALAHRVDE